LCNALSERAVLRFRGFIRIVEILALTPADALPENNQQIADISAHKIPAAITVK
jgi:hypothetical protein